MIPTHTRSHLSIHSHLFATCGFTGEESRDSLWKSLGRETLQVLTNDETTNLQTEEDKDRRTIGREWKLLIMAMIPMVSMVQHHHHWREWKNYRGRHCSKPGVRVTGSRWWHSLLSCHSTLSWSRRTIHGDQDWRE